MRLVSISTLGAAVAAIGWLPPHRPTLLVLGMAAIFYSVARAASLWRAVVVAFVGSLIFFAIADFPLASAHTWSGWVSTESGTVRPASWYLMHGLWLLITLWCSLFWTLALCSYRLFSNLNGGLRVLLTAFSWSFLAEWLRSVSHWGFEWGFVGFALADLDPIRQWASVGGVLLLGVLTVAASVLLVEVLLASGRSRLLLGISATAGLTGLWLGGVLLEQDTVSGAPSRRAAAFQFSPGVPGPESSALGVAPDWFAVLPEIAERGYDLIVLPESISSRAVQLDGTVADDLGAGRQVAAHQWRDALAPLFERHSDLTLAVGIEGIEHGNSYNTTTVWGPPGLLGWQHKVHLVPFSEYLPRGWGFLRTQALTYYTHAGEYEPIEVDEFVIGSFICQEVQHASTVRSLVRKGANVLISGGNDGVFADRRVALVHHSMARVRATEAGRFMVRAMKNGITSIIGPDGDVLGEAPGETSALVGNHVTLMSGQTLSTRLGRWPPLVGFACLLFGLGYAMIGARGSKAERG